MKKIPKERVDSFYKALKDDKKAIIAWAENEIEAYKYLIRLVKAGK